MRFAGIDPGRTGALAIIDVDNGTVAFHGVPLVGGKADYARWAKEWGAALKGVHHVGVEQVASRPGQGVASMFSFGTSYGFALALAAMSGPLSLVRPQVWRSGVGIATGAEKSAARLRASQLYPDHADQWRNAARSGYADAVLLARYIASQML